MKRIVLGSSLVLLTILFGCNNNQSISEQQGEPQVIDLTQTGCQFLETESKDHQFKTNNKKDCEGINSETLAERQSSFQTLNLKPGKYIFRVTNRDVPYELGFYLRGEGLNQARLPKVSGGGLTTGVTQDYEITLVSGKYVFSCPLNPTPDYPVIVQ